MNRADMIRAVALHEAAAKVLRARLASAAEADFRDQGIVPSWKQPGITLAGSTTQPSVTVTDEAVFLAYVEQRFPSEVETIRRPRPAWCKSFLEGVADRGSPACDAQGEEIPGLEWRAGGAWNGFSIRITSEAKAAIAAEAAEFVALAVDRPRPEPAAEEAQAA
ncbi:hypothetical protein OOJ91_11980 [Micromonospora lupini]|uniref:hypothetical protein n=1 Tax=Micromonospora lupini TaxID=285679 RepID=UPI002251CCFF|nr:hypothetical protein [Micromonospora lupini]MCX5066596.1 hypothetical protein [Micromonospora lupini]